MNDSPDPRAADHDTAPEAGVELPSPERVRRQLRQLQELQRLHHRISAERDIDRLLETAMDTVIELSRARRGFLILKADAETPERIVARNLAHQAISAPEREISSTIAHQVIDRGVPMLTADASHDPRFESCHSVRVRRLRSVVCVPLRAGSRVVGALYLDDPDAAGSFVGEDLEFYESFAELTAMALQNARRGEQLAMRERELVRSNRQLRGLIRTSQAMMVERDLEALLAMIVEQATRITEGDRSTLYLVDPTGHWLVSKIAEQAEVAEIRVPIGTGIAGRVASTRQPCRLADAYSSPDFSPEVDQQTGYQTGSVLAVPLLTHEDEVVGVIQVVNKPAGFTTADQQLLRALAAHAATALDNHRLFKHYLKKLQIEHDLQLARKIQSLLLPSAPPEIPGFELAALYQSCEETGGDYYDYFELAGNRLAIVIADVSGHGIGAALLMATARASLRAYMNSSADPALVLRQLNRSLVEDTEIDRYMTLFLCVIDLQASTMTYTNAGHPMPVLYRRTADTFVELQTRGLPVGMVREPGFKHSEPIPLRPGDLLLLLTDGVWEAVNEQEQEFGRERLCRLIRDHGEASAEALTERIHQTVTQHCRPLPLSDDFTVLAVRRNATSRQRPTTRSRRRDEELGLA